jgi:hypothetical protein
MIGRPVIRTAWFAAGAAAGVYGTVKARRAAYRLSAPGIIDQAAALGVGWRAFSADLREGMREREDAVVRSLDSAAAPALGAPPAGAAGGGFHLIAPEDPTG